MGEVYRLRLLGLSSPVAPTPTERIRAIETEETEETAGDRNASLLTGITVPLLFCTYGVNHKYGKRAVVKAVRFCQDLDSIVSSVSSVSQV